MRSRTKCLYYFFVILLEVAFIRCQCGIIPRTCPPITDIYRTFDGTCNNVEYPWWGTAYSEYDRIQPACYGDDISTPRKAQNGDDLPNPRSVRLACLPENHVDKDEEITRVFIPILQFFQHDIISSYKSAGDSSSCCSKNLQKLSKEPDHCVNMVISEEDPLYIRYNITCVPMVKMINNIDIDCDSENTQAEQINKATHFMDLSNLYGTNEDENFALRTGAGGKLLLENRNGFDYLPNDPTGSTCQIPDKKKEICYKTGNKLQKPY
ncbi:peroxidase-like [Diorhabda carinulata]|uniref:peroxidase-like n=1 Tax=Diorhabda carinulata TaxID=1163345 RepID=UPI0025A003F3|nr:peroxidase-like [Diorhabda carinulata]